ncbi:hypothetical protein SLS55_003866 [Diplodia seriata]|uniref:FAD-binding domain-containing protein n=1 Tax=Diplodia seriata TaxID=420778 RepID=A0ABR3CP77_9PEZI
MSPERKLCARFHIHQVRADSTKPVDVSSSLDPLGKTTASLAMATAPSPFKVIIAGGSLVGLGLALSLERAGIDYELFEKRELAPQLGASVGWHPHGNRILKQLGVLEDMMKISVPLVDRLVFDEHGTVIEKSKALWTISER